MRARDYLNKTLFRKSGGWPKQTQKQSERSCYFKIEEERRPREKSTLVGC